MKQRNKPEAQPHVPRLVEITITVSEADTFWLIVQGEATGRTPQQVASQIVSDVIKDDMLMAHEEDNETMH